MSARDGVADGDAKRLFGGSYTNADGERVQMTPAEAEAEKRAAEMPDEKAALRVMHDAHQRLRELGWREAIYCPKDGSSFDVIEAGSTGIFRCHYQGEWPDGSWWIEGGGDLWPSRPILFRLDPEAEAARQAKLAAARATRAAAGEE